MTKDTIFILEPTVVCFNEASEFGHPLDISYINGLWDKQSYMLTNM